MQDEKVNPEIIANDVTGNAYNAIKDLLFRRILNPGQKLPYKDLCQLIGLSKTPIINALNRLVYEGFVTYEPNKGYRITPVDEKSISQLWELRMELECINVRNAIKNFTKEKFADLKQKFEALESYVPQYTDKKKLFLDMDMHLEIGRMGGNKYAQSFLKTVLEHTHFLYRVERGVDRRSKEIKYEHRMIVESIGKRDINLAEKHMRDHIEALHQLMLNFLDDLKQKEESFWV